MTEDYRPRSFASADAIRAVGEAFVARTLPKEEWTHEAHLATCLWLIVERGDIAPEHDLPGMIAGYNASLGGVNDATQGYHETITQLYIAGIREWLGADGAAHADLCAQVNALLLSAIGHRDWPLGYYSKDRLFSAEARLGLVQPDLAPWPGKG